MPDDLSEVLSKLSDPDPTARIWALDEVGTRKPARAFEILTSALADLDPDIRVAAATNLADIADPRAIPELIRTAREDASEKVRGEAIAALSAYHSPEVLAALVAEVGRPKRSRRPRQEVAKQLANYDAESSVDALIELLEDDDVFVREYAAASLLRVNRPRLLDVWRRAALDQSEDVRNAAREALRTLEGSS